MKLRVVSVQPLYQINVGYIARVAANFGVTKLYFVRPRCKILGKKAIMYSKHGRRLLESATVCSSVSKAISGSVAVATTAEKHKSSQSFFNTASLEEIGESLHSNGANTISIVLGRDDTGLTKEEIAECDYTLSLDTGSRYKALNISHSLAVILYFLTRNPSNEMEKHASAKELERLFLLFSATVGSMDHVRNKKGVARVFERVLRRANLSSEEVAALSAAFSKNKK
jgi:tRNA/rRNA methyltransferase